MVYIRNASSCIRARVVIQMSDEDEAPPTPEQLKRDKEIIAKLQSKKKEELKKTEVAKPGDKKKAEDLFEKRLRKAK
jgi:hypothetical protein